VLPSLSSQKEKAMQKSVLIRSLLLISLTLTALTSVNAQTFNLIRPGVEYAEFIKETKDGPLRGHLLRLDLTKVRLDVVHARDMVVGVETTSAMAKRYGALAAINTGFFKIGVGALSGVPVGVLRIDGVDYTDSYGGRSTVFITNNRDATAVSIERINKETFLVLNGKKLKAGFNKIREKDDVVVYTDLYNRTTLTNSDGTEFIVNRGRITEARYGKGSSVIPSGGFVISVSGKKRAEMESFLKMGSQASFSRSTTPVTGSLKDEVLKAEDAVAGVPQIVRDGKVSVTVIEEKSSKEFSETRHPRTALAILRDGHVLLAVFDGRQPGHSVGVSLDEMAEILVGLGADVAVNFDGGGSTAMYLDGKVVNKPSDKEGERPVSDAILVNLRDK